MTNNPYGPETIAESDDTLMGRIGRGDEGAFAILYRRWARRVMAYAYRSLSDREEAEDVVQETFLSIFRSASRYRPCERFGAYLFRIAGNGVRSRCRRRNPVMLVDFSETAEGCPEPVDEDDPFGRFEEAETLDRALAMLSFEQRESFLLAVVAGLSYREIASLADVSEDAVAARICRARKNLKKILSSWVRKEEEKVDA